MSFENDGGRRTKDDSYIPRMKPACCKEALQKLIWSMQLLVEEYDHSTAYSTHCIEGEISRSSRRSLVVMPQ